jgi:hypothetical protein
VSARSAQVGALVPHGSDQAGTAIPGISIHPRQQKGLTTHSPP